MKAQSFTHFLRLTAAAGLLSLSGVAWSAPVVDVLVLYVDAAQNTSAGRDIDARVGSYIAYSNQAFANSDVDMRFRLVGTEKVNLNYTYVTEANLAALRTNREVAQLRQKYGADLVTLINLRQPVSGGYVCGIGYVPPGDPNTGRLYSNASSAAFSLVGVDCGLSTFAHELGHNMSLGHSYVQSSQGGVWPWARGHGVQGLFSTIMAYPQSYGTRNQVQQFSNPNQAKCVGQACGVSQQHREGADAAVSLNRLGAQIEAYVPQIVTTDSGAGNPPALPPCNKDEPEGNLIANGDFNALTGWSSAFKLSRLVQAEVHAHCVDKLLLVDNRTQRYSDAYHDLGATLKVGTEYRFSGKFGIANASRDTVRFALRIEENGRVRYQYLQALSATSSELTAYNDHFRLDAGAQPDRVGLLIYGPQAGVNIVADEVALVALVDQAVEAPSAAPEDSAILHDRFEQSASGWASYGGSRTAFSSHAWEGSYSLLNQSRSYSYSGPIREVTGLFEAETAYEVTAGVYVSDRYRTSSSARIWVYYVDDQGEHWLPAANATVSTNVWQEVHGSFHISPVGEITQMRLLVGGPRAFVDLYLDDLKVSRQ